MFPHGRTSGQVSVTTARSRDMGIWSPEMGLFRSGSPHPPSGIRYPEGVTFFLEENMSLYNMLFGVNPYAMHLLQMLEVDYKTIPRFRDCFLNRNGTEIIIHTRTGGGNREEYSEQNNALCGVKGYKFNLDDSFDCTYANWHYEVPEEYRTVCISLAEQGGSGDPQKAWQDLFERMKHI